LLPAAGAFDPFHGWNDNLSTHLETHTRVRSTFPVYQRIISLASVAVLSVVFLLDTAGCTRKKQPDAVAPIPVGSLVRDWKFDLDLSRRDDEIRGLYLRDKILYAYTQRNTVVALDAASGRALFSADVTPDGIPLKPPIPLKDRVAFPNGATIEVYDLRGKKVESVDAERSIRSPGVAFENTIYIALSYPAGARLAALDLSRRFDRARWELMSPGTSISAAPTVSNNVIYVASEDGIVRAVNLDRTPAWPLEDGAFRIDGSVVADLKVDDLALYVASTDTKLYALDRSSGRIRWQYYAGAPLKAAPVVTANTIYQLVPGLGMAALDKTEGKFNREPKWIAHGAQRFLAEGEKHVYLLGGDNRIVALDKASGAPQFKSKRADLVAFAVNPTGEMIYGSTRDGSIIGVQPVTQPGTVGTMVWTPVEPDADQALLADAR
jgi:outer membrane protein assembly factor BamB